MTINELLKLINSGESEVVEFKASFQRELIEAVVAFANSRGGVILIGVKDNGTISGVSITDETLKNWLNQIKTNTAPSVIPEIESYEIDGHTVVVLKVSEQPVKPIAFKNRYYKRIRNSNHLMSLDEIATEHLRTINGSWDYHIDTRHGFDDISMDKIAVLIDKIEKNRGRPFEDSFLTVLQKYELIRGGEITFGAYLLFVENFSAITAMQLGRFKSETKIIDNLDLSTDLFSEIEKTIEFIKKHLMVEYIITGKPQREERYDYPLEAVREIVINMVVHRDYRDSGNSVIKIFDDRIEFFNPGKLYDDITVEKLISGNYSSRTRNRLIANIFKDCGLIERYGSGIKRIRNECFKYGIEEPLFEEFQHGFRVILFKKHKFRQENNDGGVNVGDGGVSVGDGGVNSDSEIFIFIKENPGCKSSLISADSGHSKRTVERSLRRLREQNLIEFQGSSKKGGYFVVGDGGVNGGDGGVSVGDGGVSVGDGGVNSDNEIFIFIKENPGCKSSLISADSGHSKRTVERSLRRLREQNLIEFQGSSKKGGYFVVGDGGVSGGVSGGVNGGVNGKH